MAVEDTVRFSDEAGRRQAVDTLVETPIRLLIHLQRDLPLGPALIAADRNQMLDGEAGLGDHLQHLGEASGLVDSLDDQYLGYFHKGADDTMPL